MPKERSMIDTAVWIMSNEKKSFDLYDLFDRVSEEMNLSEEQQHTLLSKFYADMTTSAKFIYVGDNEWNLKANEKVELWDKDGSFYKEYNVVELPEEYKIDPYATVKKPKPQPQPQPTVTVVEKAVEAHMEAMEEELDETVVEPKKPVVEPVVEPIDFDEEAPVVELEEDEVFDDYDDFDEEKYNEYMDSYEDQYDD